MSPKLALASTLGCDYAEFSEYRYQPTRNRGIYTYGDYYWVASKTPPKYGDGDITWEKHSDQFWAEKANTIIWRGVVTPQ